MSTVNVTIRMENELKKEAERLFSDLGINMTTALTIFIKQAVREQRIPFSISKDPFYSENNMAHLRRGILALNSGQGIEHQVSEVE